MATLSSDTLQQLITNVRDMLGEPNPTNSYWTDEELTRYLNEGIKLYFNEVIQLDQGHFTTTTTLNITANTETIALPSDCVSVVNLYKKVQDEYVLLPYRPNRTQGYSTKGGNTSTTYLPSYYFRGNNIVLRDTPEFSETAGLLLEYVQFPTIMLYGGDTLTSQVAPIFTQVVEMYGVYKAKLKESMRNGSGVHQVAESNLGTLLTQFKDAVADRARYPKSVEPFDP